MRRTLLALLLALPGAALAEDRRTLGVGRLLSNDLLGDGRDRWRSGSFALSIVRGPAWDGSLPNRPGALLEYRLRSEIIQPSNLSAEGEDDRPYAASLSAGLHAHWAALGGEASLGGDLVAVGPRTGLGELQDGFHDLIGAPSLDVLEGQVGDAVRLSGTLAFVRPLRLGPSVTLRPFAEATGGVEDVLRAGADVVWGGVGHDDLWIRDVPTGQLYRGVEGPATGFAVVAGADWAAVGDSLWLPEGGEAARARARVGVHWQVAPRTSVFYGLAYLAPEFEGQEEGQVLGQLKFGFSF